MRPKNSFSTTCFKRLKRDVNEMPGIRTHSEYKLVERVKKHTHKTQQGENVLYSIKNIFLCIIQRKFS